jgi:hypothetical protein
MRLFVIISVFVAGVISHAAISPNPHVTSNSDCSARYSQHLTQPSQYPQSKQQDKKQPVENTQMAQANTGTQQR